MSSAAPRPLPSVALSPRSAVLPNSAQAAPQNAHQQNQQNNEYNNAQLQQSYSHSPQQHYAHPHPPPAGPSGPLSYSSYGRPPSGPASAYAQPIAHQAYNNYSQHSQGAHYPQPPAIRYSQPQPGGARLSGLLHPSPPSRSPTQSQQLNLPPILPPPSPQQQQPRPIAPQNGSASGWGEAGVPGAGASGLAIDPKLAPPAQSDIDVGQPRAVPSKKRPFDDLLGATASAAAENAADKDDSRQSGDMLAYIVKKAVQMTNKAKLEAVETDASEAGGPAKKFPCPHQLCGRKFARSWNLQAHLKSHMGVRDFSCPECGKLFSRKHDCTRHCIAIHLYDKEGNKPPQPIKRTPTATNAHSPQQTTTNSEPSEIHVNSDQH